MQAYILIVKNTYNDAMDKIELIDLTRNPDDAAVAIHAVFPDSKVISMKNIEQTLTKDIALHLLN